MSQKQTRINKFIRGVSEVRLIDEHGEQVGIVSFRDALIRAQDLGNDLVEISPNARPPVCRIMDYGKYQFEQSKRLAAQKKKQKLVHVKEVKFRPATDIGDYQIKMRKIMTFLERGDKVKVSLRFRGREMQHRELGMDLMNRVLKDVEEQVGKYLVVEQQPKMEGRQMTMVLVKGKAS